MCIALTLNLSKEQFANASQAKLLDFIEWQPFQNVVANGFFPVMTNEFAGVIQYFKWGLVPVWAKNVAMGTNMTRTKKENLLEKTALQAIFRYKRCVIPVTSFTIWLDKEKKETTEIFANNNALFWLCGMWDVWGEGLQSFSVLTHTQTFKDKLIEVPISVTMDQIKVWLDKKSANLNLIEKVKPVLFAI